VSGVLEQPVKPGNRVGNEAPGKRGPSAKLIAVLASLLGIISALAIPFLPVQQQAASVAWPQDPQLTNVDLPLVAYAPLTFDATIPCASVRSLAQSGGGTLLATSVSADAARYGFVARVTSDPSVVEITQRGEVVATQALGSGNCDISVKSAIAGTTVTLGAQTFTTDEDLRPQVVGIYTDLKAPQPGLSVSMDLDSRFSSSPSLLKLAAMIVAVLATALSLVALHRIDSMDGRASRRWLPQHWWTFTWIDAAVIGTLVLWHFIGSTTSDDGYQFTMARASIDSGYMANYFRWFGVPEAPFGTPYYDLLALMTRVSTASPWMRLPALCAGILAWLLISREVAPRLGAAVRSHKVALWTGALVFLSFWLPYNNGLRPEPIVAVGVLLTWCLVERAIAMRRLLPAAGAVLVGALTLSAGPSGLICFGALIAGARPVLQIIVARAKTVGYLALLGPVVSAGLVILVAIFADQPLASVLEMQRVHAIGPDMPWFDEHLRYQWLFQIGGADGSLARRFGVLVMILCIIVALAVMLRKGRIPGTSSGPSRRIIGITIAAMLLMTFTPTKWTHHFGIYAGLAGSLAMLAAVAVSPVVLRSRRNRALFAAGVFFITALSFAGTNGWWYVSSYGIPWWDKPVVIAGLGVSTMALGVTVLTLFLAAWCFFREPFAKESKPGRVWRTPILAVVAGFMVVFEVASFVKGAVAQYPAFSVARSNVGALAGSTCGLADDVLVEADPNKGMLAPVSGSLATSLAASSIGFTPDGIAEDLTPEEETATDPIASSVSNGDGPAAESGFDGGVKPIGINGSRAALPFGLDSSRVPVLGSFGYEGEAALATEWYNLPAGGDLIAIAAAGRIRSVDNDGIVTPGVDIQLEYGVRNGNSVDSLGSITPLDIGPRPSWRNLRVPMSSIPAEADAVRIVMEDSGANVEEWAAITPPRVPQTQTLNAMLGRNTPVLVDWEVGLQFPCQRPFSHNVGVAEIPEYRILPDRPGTVMTSAWQDHFGGGPLGWIQMSVASRVLPTYLRDNWERDWGSLMQYTPLDPDAVPGKVNSERVSRSGLWTPGPINVVY
jgi:arabinosyltransferase C